jgi:hypothetical protein
LKAAVRCNHGRCADVFRTLASLWFVVEYPLPGYCVLPCNPERNPLLGFAGSDALFESDFERSTFLEVSFL